MIKKTCVRRTSAFVIYLLCCAFASNVFSQPVHVAAASSLRGLWSDLISTYPMNDHPIRVSFASSGLLTTQIRHGAPFDLFLPADVKYTEILQTLGKAPNTGVTIALGTLTLVSHDTSLTNKPLSLESVAETLTSDSSSSLTIANPRHAPYGAAAREVLEKSALWPLRQGQLFIAENASQALHYAQQKLTSFAIVPTSLVQASQHNLQTSQIAQDLYSPVEHRVVKITNTKEADFFYQWLQGDQAQLVLNKHGFIAPQ